MRHFIRGSLLLLLSGLLLGCNGTPKQSGEPPRVIEPAPPTLLSWPMWKQAKDTASLIGQEMPDVALRDIDGKPWILSRHRGKTIVMQAGSASSPSYVNSLDAYAGLVDHMGPDLVHVTIYSEEAHPELIGPANKGLRWVLSGEDRTALAAAGSYSLVATSASGKMTASGRRGAGQTVLVDYVDQTQRIENVWGLELGYGRGAAENPVVVIDAEGTVVWAHADLSSSMGALDAFLHEHLHDHGHGDEHMDDDHADEDAMDDHTDEDHPDEDHMDDDQPSDDQ